MGVTADDVCMLTRSKRDQTIVARILGVYRSGLWDGPRSRTLPVLESVAHLHARLRERSGEVLHHVTGNGKHELAGLNVRRVRVGFAG
jgi:hypothetical protein